MFGIREAIVGREPDPPDTVIYRMPWWCASLPAVPWLLTGAVVSLVLLQRAPSAAVVPWNTLVVYFVAPALLLVWIGHKLSRTPLVFANRYEIHWWPAWRLSWSDVDGVELRNVLGVRYLLLKRRKGRSYTLWWSPPGARDFAVRLLEVAPEKGAFRQCVEFEQRRISAARAS